MQSWGGGGGAGGGEVAEAPLRREALEASSGQKAASYGNTVVSELLVLDPSLWAHNSQRISTMGSTLHQIILEPKRANSAFGNKEEASSD